MIDVILTKYEAQLIEPFLKERKYKYEFKPTRKKGLVTLMFNSNQIGYLKGFLQRKLTQ